MNSEPPASAANPSPAETFAVTYESGRIYNRDLAGRGTLEVRPDGFVFRGRQRRTLLVGPETELILRPDEIRNVVVGGPAVEFVTPTGRSGAKKAPFVFFCEDADTALRAAELLPAARDAAFEEAESFRTKLQAIAVAERRGISVTSWLIGANIVVYVIMGLLGAGWFETASMRPYRLYVANNGAATTDGEWWRLVTAMFVHFGLLHLFFNMYALLQVGDLVEKLLGRACFALMYFASGIIGSLATLLWHGDQVWSAGASGAVFGVYGALLGYLWREQHGVPRSILQPLLQSSFLFAGYNLFFGAVHPHIDNVAHVGGLLGGVLFGAMCALPLDREIRARRTTRRLALGAVVLAGLTAVGVATAPRFDYVVRDQVRLEDALAARGDQEKALLKRQTRLFQAAETSEGDAALAAWLKEEAVPFYRDWGTALAALPLRPGYRTTKRREALVAIMGMKVHSYEALLEGLAQHTDSAWDHFAEEQKAIHAAIAALDKDGAS